MIRNITLLIAVVIFTLAISLGAIRYFAPGLLGIAQDLQLVQVDKKVPPFFRNIFRANDYGSGKFLIDDPITKHRARPKHQDQEYFGPHDILGFRNNGVPNYADVIFIGDSQTYGNYASIDQNYPSQVKLLLADRISGAYSMAVGGWGGIQYFDMFEIARNFKPKVVVVAYYSGNDPLESLAMAYGNRQWKQFIPDTDIDHTDLPPGKYPAPEETWWKVKFKDGIKTDFTPRIRLKSNADHPTVDVAWEVLHKTAKAISEAAKETPVKVVFTVIPTKELVYAEKVKVESIDAPAEYTTLVESEQRRINRFAAHIKSLKNVEYVDVVKPLQREALTDKQLYQETINGHPIFHGYRAIADVIAEKLRPMLKPLPSGLNAILYSDGYNRLILIRGGRYWYFNDKDLVVKNGWATDQSIPFQNPSILSNLEYAGEVNEVDPDQFGPD